MCLIVSGAGPRPADCGAGEPADTGPQPLLAQFRQDGRHVIGRQGREQGMRGVFRVRGGGGQDRGMPVPEPVRPDPVAGAG
jgi:hypothetical protein